jgi:hypothetical protein
LSTWQDMDLSTVVADNSLLPERDYNFTLDGAKYNQWNPQKIDVSAKVADGEFVGRKVFFSYPEPNKFEWSPNVLRRLLDILGVEPEANEGAVDALNRGVGGSFSSVVTHKTITNHDTGEESKRANLDIFKVKAAK